MDESIHLAGFTNVKSTQVDILHKKIGHYASVFRLKGGTFEELRLTRKDIGPSEHPIHDVQVNLVRGSQVLHASSQDRTVTTAVEQALRLIEDQIAKAQ
ncbi:MAG: hypothetical protein ACMXYF_00115 [Candidatus Woesearchaeota archaeon]